MKGANYSILLTLARLAKVQSGTPATIKSVILMCRSELTSIELM
jgi:hypothetical protein